MAISTDNQEYEYARKQADDLLHRSFHGITSTSTAEETQFLSPALCSVSAEFFRTQEESTVKTHLRSSLSWNQTVGKRPETQWNGESFGTTVAPTLQESLHDHLQRIELEVGGGRIHPSILGPFHALALRRYPVLPKQRESKNECINRDLVETVEQLTNLIFQSSTQGVSTNKMTAKEQFHKFGSSLPKKVCQHPFKRNDIVWVCRTCQSDETCVLCHKCFENSHHEGHDVAFYHAQAGGCCDCGDPDAWDPKGFCPLHGKDVAIPLDKSLELRVEAVIESCVKYLNQFAENVERGYRRANNQTGFMARSGKRKFGRSHSVMAVDRERGSIGTEGSHAEHADREIHRYNTLSVDDHDYSLTRGTADNALSSHSSYLMDTSVRTLDMMSDHSMDIEDDLEEVGESSLDMLENTNDSDDNSPNNGEECKFDPRAASTSKSRTLQTSSHNSSMCSEGEDEPSHDFDPEAASTSKSLSCMKKRDLSENNMTPAQRLGNLGCQQEGLFLVLHADDVHKPAEVSDALRKLYNTHPLWNHGNLDNICNKIVDVFQQDIGDIILWGTYELMNELGPVLSLCWRDNDELACTRFGALMLEKAKLLTDCGMVVSIKTRHELCSEVRCAAVLEFLNLMSGSCDPLCRLASVGLGAKDADENGNENDEGNDEKSVFILEEKNIDSRAGVTHTLRTMLVNDLRLPRKVAKSWHDLLLTLLAVPNFKAALANAYVDTYASITSEYARGIGIFEKSAYTLSVQFLNRVIYVEDLVKERDLLGCLIRSLFGTLAVARKSGLHFVHGTKVVTATTTLSSTIDNMLDFYSMALSYRDAAQEQNLDLSQQLNATRINTILDTQHAVISQRRYGPCVSDLKCVLNVPGVARIFASLPKSKLDNRSKSCLIAKPCIIDAWIQLLSICQNMDLQRWRRREEGHVEQEPRDWVGAFNAGIAIGSLYERLLNWEDEDEKIDSPLFYEAKKTNIFLTAAELTHYILVNGIDSWQCAEALNYVAVFKQNFPEESCSNCLPFASVTCNHGTLTAMKALPISQCHLWSFHIPLHRFVAFCVREVARRPYSHKYEQNQDVAKLLTSMIQKEDSKRLFRIYSGLLEYPLMIIARNSEIRSDLWLRNGKGMFDQVLNYAEPHFCKGLRDADLTLMQFAFICLLSLKGEDSRISDVNNLHQSFSCAHLVNLFLHRFGIFDYAGFKRAPEIYKMRYSDEVINGLHPPEKQLNEVERLMPVSFPPSDDPVRLKSLLEELLHTLIMFITELPAPPPLDSASETQQAKIRLRREVIHRLASGPKAHSELAEIHHVLSMRDNMVLSEEGKLVNPDDANGAALEAALVEVADCKSFQGRSDTWELQRWAWNEYDPAFFHLSTAQHQNASELRPSSTNSEECVITPMPYAPFPPAAHTSFVRLRRDITSDSCVVGIIYRALHVHCRSISENDEFFHNIDAKQQQAYISTSWSETVLGRAIHLLTLGAYAWETELSSSGENWKTYGGGDSGSVFHEFTQPPTQRDWVEKVLLAHPHELMDSSLYSGEKNSLQLLRVLVTDGGSEHFKVQDKSIRCGAAWLCEYATRISPDAATLLGNHKLAEVSLGMTDNLETHYQRRSREAKERALKLMQAQMAKFANALDINDSDGNSDHASTSFSGESEVPNSPSCLSSIVNDGNGSSGRVTPATADSKVDFIEHGLQNGPGFPDLEKRLDVKIGQQSYDSDFKKNTRSYCNRLLDERPRCIICADDGLVSQEDVQCDLEDDHENKPKKKVLAWCGYIQASTVFKGDGGLSSGEVALDAQLVGIHVSVCGHAIHQSCCEAHSKDSLRREGDIYDRYDWRGEFKCPLCRRISNCLIPFIDVSKSWAENVTTFEETGNEKLLTLHDFLSKTRWWTTRNDRTCTWNGRCSFVPNNVTNDHHSSGTTNMAFGKKDLCKAWGHVLWTPPYTSRNYLWAQTSAAVTAVYRKILDQVSEISYKSDSKRIGEGNLQHNLGEFRHYLVEKVAYNEEHQVYWATSLTEWPSCVFPAPTQEKRQALSREKLISKHLLAIQALTYSCCCEITECIRLAKNSTTSNLDSIRAKFGVQRFTCGGEFLVLPLFSGKAIQLFDGKIGRLRYLALALMVATSPISREVVHMTMNLPSPSKQSSIATDLESSTNRAPIVYPILHGHILTHVVATICAICGQERTRHEAISTVQSILPSLIPTLGTGPDDALNECMHFVQLGYLATTLQVLFGTLCSNLSVEWSSLESQIIFILHAVSTHGTLSPWEKECLLLLRTAMSSYSNEASDFTVDSDFHEHVSLFSKACLKARGLCEEYVYNIGIIFQIILPRSVELFQNMEGAQKVRQEEIDELLNIFGIRHLVPMLDSPLTAEILEYWYEQARRTESAGLVKSLNAYPLFRVNDWPHLQHEPSCYVVKTPSTRHPKKYLPLLGGYLKTAQESSLNDTKNRITSLPISYTDLYAKLGTMLPDCELTAVCFVCGEVLDAGGKGECTRHTLKCGAGCGLFFLLQDCICLGMHRDTAAFITSPYVDSHGETPQYRGRPLNMDESRYEFLHELWSGHLLREYVIAERSKSMRNIWIANNFY
mmetsp:Transcript_12443/g.23345  ORF Transcript_12443/g.23345 Transcript_12443/m.23345 type:complete len:2568 (-) Transcript_12443:2177-9880(-)